MEAGEPSDLWVFGYGSLMWRPGFPFLESLPGRLRGYHRSLCVLSHVHRGTPERPGLVLGLDRGGSCRGMAFRVAGPEAAATLAYLREREQVTAVYVERVLGPGDAAGRVIGRRRQHDAVTKTHRLRALAGGGEKDFRSGRMSVFF